MNRLLVVHKGEGKKTRQGKRQPPSYRTAGQVGALVRYALAPARQSQSKERVAGLVDGMGLGLADGEALPPSMAPLLTRQLVDDVPDGRRKIRHVILALASDFPVVEQARILGKACRRYAARYASGCSFLAVLHDDHNGEDGRGLHAHVIIRNSDGESRALDWSREDLKEQQSMTWAAGLDVVPTRGTGVPRRRGEPTPYPKSKNLNAKKLGELTDEQFEELVKSGRLVAGRRSKTSALASVVLNGRRIRLSTARALSEREQRLVDLRPAGALPNRRSQADGFLDGVAVKPSQPENQYPAGWNHLARPVGLGFGFGPETLVRSRGRQRQRGRRAVRGVKRVVKEMLATVASMDKLGRVL